MRKKIDHKEKKMRKIFTVMPPTSVNMTKVPELQLPIRLEGRHIVNFDVDTGAADNLLGKTALSALEEPRLQDSIQQFKSASQHKLPILGSVNLQAETNDVPASSQEVFIVIQGCRNIQSRFAWTKSCPPSTCPPLASEIQHVPDNFMGFECKHSSAKY